MKRWLGSAIAGVLAGVLLIASLASCAPAATPTTAPRPTAAPTLMGNVSTPTPTSPTTPVATPTPVPPIMLKFSHALPATHVLATQIWIPFANELEQRTGGRVKVTFYPAAALGKYAEHYDMARTGVADIVYAVPSYTPGVFDLTSVGGLPFAVPSSVAGSTIYNKLYQRSPAIQKEFASVKLLWLFATSTYQLFTTDRQVKTIDDLKGLKIRSPGGEFTPATQALGMVPIAVDPTETYTALQRGEISGTVGSYGVIDGRKWQEVLKNVTVGVDFGSVPLIVAMNKARYESLPKDIQATLDELLPKYAKVSGQVYDSEETRLLPIMQASGMKFYTLPPEERAKWVVAIKPVWDAWADKMEKKGLPGKDVMNTLKSILQEEGIKVP